MNLTNDRKNTNKRTYIIHSFIDVHIYFIFSVIFLIVAVKALSIVTLNLLKTAAEVEPFRIYISTHAVKLSKVTKFC